MAGTEVKLSEYKRTVVCPCGVELDLRTQGLLCPGCRAKFRMERKRNMTAAWDRFHQRHIRQGLSGETVEAVEALIEEMERLVSRLDSARLQPGRPRMSPGTPAAGSRSEATPRRGGGIPVDRLESE